MKKFSDPVIKHPGYDCLYDGFKTAINVYKEFMEPFLFPRREQLES
jgi:hypothetical protein